MKYNLFNPFNQDITAESLTGVTPMAGNGLPVFPKFNTESLPAKTGIMDRVGNALKSPMGRDILNNFITAMGNDTDYINYNGIPIPIKRGVGERINDFSKLAINTSNTYNDTSRLSDIYKGLGINIPQGQFKTPQELADYAKLSGDIKKQSDLSEYRTGLLDLKEQLLKLQAMTKENELNNKQTTREQLYNDSPIYQKYLQSQVDPQGKFDFSGGQNAEYLRTQLKNMYGIDLTAPISTEYGLNLLKGVPQVNQSRIENTNTKTQYIPKEYQLKLQKLQQQKAYNDRRLSLLAQRVAQGDSGAKAEYNTLRNTSLQLGIDLKKQTQKINDLMIQEYNRKGGALPTAPTITGDSILWGE